MTSGWTLAHGDAAASSQTATIEAATIAGRRYRAPDPWYRVDGTLVVRRLSPNNRKIEADKHGDFLLTKDVLEAMGQELGNIHADRRDVRAIAADLDARKPAWLAKAAERAADAMEADYKQLRKRRGS